jgi:tetratricopeptide (TPR) repeat protein
VTRAAVIVAVVVAACARPAPRVPAPAEDVRREIDQAETAERARRHDEARTHYQRAVANAKDPASIAFARREYGETLMSWGEYPEAIAQLEGVIAVAPNHVASWNDLGLLHHNQGNDTRAIEALERARDLAPRDWRPRRNLAVLRWKRGDRAGALAEYSAMLELDLPDRLRDKVTWAITELRKPAGASSPGPRPE